MSICIYLIYIYIGLEMDVLITDVYIYLIYNYINLEMDVLIPDVHLIYILIYIYIYTNLNPGCTYISNIYI